MNCLKYLKNGVEQKRGETKILKRGASWVKGGCLKRGSPLTNYGRAPMRKILKNAIDQFENSLLMNLISLLGRFRSL